MAPNRDPNEPNRANVAPVAVAPGRVAVHPTGRGSTGDREIGMAPKTNTAARPAANRPRKIGPGETKTGTFRAVLREYAGGPGVAVDPDGPGGISAATRTVSAAFVAAGRGGFDYAFAYGRAAATPDPDFPGRSYAATRANRRGSKTVSTADGIVTVRIVGADGTAAGSISVDTRTGAVRRIAAKSTGR